MHRFEMLPKAFVKTSAIIALKLKPKLLYKAELIKTQFLLTSVRKRHFNTLISVYNLKIEYGLFKTKV